MNRYIIICDNKERLFGIIKQFSTFQNPEINVFLNHFIYENDEEQNGDYYLFYQSLDIQIDQFLTKINMNDILDENIIKIKDLSEDILSEIDRMRPNTIYISNFPRNFTTEKLIELLSSLPNNLYSTNKPTIERLPCVFKIVYNNSESCINWIKSILCFIPNIHFSFENINMSAETNCINVPVIHFIDLPQSFTTIEYFIELMKNDLGNFKSYEPNDQNDKKCISFNISYQTNDEAWDVIDQMNFQTYGGKEIRVNHFIDTKFLQKMSKFNIKVTNYEGSLNSFDIYESFLQFGSIYSIYNSNPIIDGEENEESDQKVQNSSNEFFCVQYYMKENAIDAINNAPTKLNMKNLTLTTKEAGIVVYNFENNITEQKVKSIFPCATKVVIKKSPDKNSRPFVFVNFICQEDCDDAIEKCKITYSDHLLLMCVPQTMPKKQAFNELKKEEEKYQKRFTVFIQGIPANIHAEDIIQKCAKFGDIDSAVYIDMKKKRSRNIAKISYHSEEAFQEAVNKSIVFNNVKIKLRKYVPQSTQ